LVLKTQGGARLKRVDWVIFFKTLKCIKGGIWSNNGAIERSVVFIVLIDKNA
jgi:hypothetical protein